LVGAATEQGCQQSAGFLRASGAGEFDIRLASGLAGLVGGQCLLISGQRLAVGRYVQRLTVGENARKLLAADAGPMAHIAYVHMHEGRAGGRVVAYAAALHPECYVAQLPSRKSVV